MKKEVLNIIYLCISFILVFLTNLLAIISTHSLTKENFIQDLEYRRKAYTGLYISSWYIIILKSIANLLVFLLLIACIIIFTLYLANLITSSSQGLLGEDGLLTKLLHDELIKMIFGSSKSTMMNIFIFVLIPILLLVFFSSYSTINKNTGTEKTEENNTKSDISQIKEHMHHVSFFIFVLILVVIQIYAFFKNNA
jgi:predicted histidine transporter YuiF (NhaC family)